MPSADMVFANVPILAMEVDGYRILLVDSYAFMLGPAFSLVATCLRITPQIVFGEDLFSQPTRKPSR